MIQIQKLIVESYYQDLSFILQHMDLKAFSVLFSVINACKNAFCHLQIYLVHVSRHIHNLLATSAKRGRQSSEFASDFSPHLGLIYYA